MSALLVALRVFRLYNCSPWDIPFQLNSPQPSCSLLNWGKKIGKPKFNSGQVVHRPHHLISQEHQFTFLIMMEVVLVGGLVVGSWSCGRWSGWSSINHQQQQQPYWDDGWRLPPAPAVAELRMRMVAAIRGGGGLPAAVPPEPRTRWRRRRRRRRREGAERSPAPRLRRSRRRMRGGLGGHDGQPGAILT